MTNPLIISGSQFLADFTEPTFIPGLHEMSESGQSFQSVQKSLFHRRFGMDLMQDLLHEVRVRVHRREHSARTNIIIILDEIVK